MSLACLAPGSHMSRRGAQVTRPTIRGGSRTPAMLLVFLILVATGLLVADRIAAGYTADRMEGQVRGELASHDISTGSTTVTIEGFPFLTQVASGRYDRIRIDMSDVEANGARLPRLLVMARGVRADPQEVANGT